MTGVRIQIVERKGRSCCAGQKAPDDIAFFAAGCGWQPLRIKRYLHPNRFLKAFGTLWWLVQSFFWVRRVPRGATVLFPFPGDYLAGRLGVRFLRGLRERRGARMVGFVHDLEELRAEHPDAVAWARQVREAVFAVADELIVHNEAMAAQLRAWGCRQPLHLLGIFDYRVSRPLLSSTPSSFCTSTSHQHLLSTLSLVGSFGNFRARYARHLTEIPGVTWQLLGPEGEGLAGWEGCYEPEEVIHRLAGSWGLVWDGDSLETCTGTCGRYLALNNPHKLSLYLAAGIPVVIWEGAALASFVTTHGVGIAIGSLRELPARLAAVSDGEYARLRAAAAALGEELRAGAFTRRVLEGL